MATVRSKIETYVKGKSVVLEEKQVIAYIEVSEHCEPDGTPLRSESHLILRDLSTGQLKAKIPAQPMWLNLIVLPDSKLFIESNVNYHPSALLDLSQLDKVAHIKRSQLLHPVIYQDKVVYAALNEYPELHLSNLNELTEERKSDYQTPCLPSLEKDKKWGIKNIAVAQDKKQIAVSFHHEIHLMKQEIKSEDEETQFALLTLNKIELDAKFDNPVTKLLSTPAGFVSINQGNERTIINRQKVTGGSVYKILCRIGWFVGMGPEAKEEEISDVTFNLLDCESKGGIKESWTPDVGVNVESEFLALPHSDGVILSYVRNSKQIILWNIHKKTREIFEIGTPILSVFVEENSHYFGIIPEEGKPILFDLTRMQITDFSELQQYRKQCKSEINQFFCNDMTSILTSYLWGNKNRKKVKMSEEDDVPTPVQQLIR